MTNVSDPYNKCPHCGEVTGYTRENRWLDPTEVPCSELSVCVAKLRERIDRLEQRLDDHRL